MYKLLIAEDEPIEREALADFIDWPSLGVELAGCAESAEEAVNLALSASFDIFFTDVRLPGTPGHELARLLLQHQPRLKVVICGSYDDYDFAMQGEEMRACSFVAKPVDMGELKAVVTRIVRELDDERLDAKSDEKLRRLVQDNMKLIRGRFFERLVSGSLSDAEILKNLEYFGMDAVQGRFAILLTELDGFDRQSMSLGWEALQMMLEGIREAVLGLGSEGLMDFYYIDRGRFAAILRLSAADPGAEAQHIFTVAERIRSEAALYSGGSVTVGTGCTVSRIRDLKHSFRTAAAALQSKASAGRGQVISYADAAIPDFEPGQVDMAALEDALASSLETANAAEARNHVDRLVSTAKRRGWSEHRACTACMRLLSRIAMLLNDLEESDEEAFEGGEVWTRMLECRSIADMHGILNACVTKAAEQLKLRRAGADRSVVSLMLDSIDRRFDSRITASDLASEFSRSPHYVSAVFKREIGKTLQDYVRDVRLEKACALLKSPSNRIGEIAIKVGYPNVSYFCSLFKKRYGANPGEYREKQ